MGENKKARTNLAIITNSFRRPGYLILFEDVGPWLCAPIFSNGLPYTTPMYLDETNGTWSGNMALYRSHEQLSPTDLGFMATGTGPFS